jgi:two-component system, sporulation sensor kinase D
MTEDQQQKLFRMFQDKDDLNKVGQGLGLTLCKKIIDSFDGKISVHSKLGQGTEVIFRFKPIRSAF